MPFEMFVGMLMGAIITLAIQFYGNRRVKRMTRQLSDEEARRGITLLDRENDQRIGQIDRLQERLATVERIVTDRSHHLDREIEQLRHTN